MYRAAAGAVALALMLAACGSDNDGREGGSDDAGGSDETVSEEQADPDADVTITIGNLPPTDEAESRQNFLDRVEEFEQTYPNITVEPEETRWQQETFNAMLAGGTMPTVMMVPYTEPRGLIARGQVADITAEFTEVDSFGTIREQLLDNVKDPDGNIYGVPINAYSVALIYNRTLFEEAGLDPDAPPTTWAEVREAAQAITEATGEPGYAQMTTDNTGGWMLSALTYSFGGAIQEPDGDAYRAAFNDQPTKDALEFLRTLRWEDGVMGENFLMNQPNLREEFAAGRVGMYMDGADAYGPMVANFGLDPEEFGVTGLPQQDGPYGTLGGGSVQVVRPDASPEERLAALKWVDFYNLRQWSDPEFAASIAESRNADGLEVAGPRLPVVDHEQYGTYLTWVEEFINVPQQNLEPYMSTIDSLPLIAEPPAKGQETYAALDPVVQAVLTRDGADIDQLLGDAEAQVNSVLAIE
jgi:ABC-type glycerol-3-phosphate transport system substrate-binding protein